MIDKLTEDEMDELEENGADLSPGFKVINVFIKTEVRKVFILKLREEEIRNQKEFFKHMIDSLIIGDENMLRLLETYRQSKNRIKKDDSSIFKRRNKKKFDDAERETLKKYFDPTTISELYDMFENEELETFDE